MAGKRVSLDPLSIAVGAIGIIAAQWVWAAADVCRFILVSSGRRKLASLLVGILIGLSIVAVACWVMWLMADALRLIAYNVTQGRY